MQMERPTLLRRNCSAVGHHPKVCVSFVDVFRQRGFKIIGSASIVAPDDEQFSQLGADLLRMAGQDFPIRHVISIRIERVSRIWAPSYALFPERTELERMEIAFSTYGVAPVDRRPSLSEAEPPA